MSVAKRDQVTCSEPFTPISYYTELKCIYSLSVYLSQPNSPQPEPANEDEGKSEQNGDQRFARTSQALKWAKTGINEAKLFVYAKTGQIQESQDPEDISMALQKLDTYREQLSRLLHNAENWTKSLLQTWYLILYPI